MSVGRNQLYMEDIIEKITELEKKSADEIERIKLLCNKKIDNAKSTIEEQRTIKKKEIIEDNKKRKIKKIEVAKLKIEEERSTILSEKDQLLKDFELCKRLKEYVISIILEP